MKLIPLLCSIKKDLVGLSFLLVGVEPKSHFSEEVTEICDFELPGIPSFQTSLASDGILLCSYHGQG